MKRTDLRRKIELTQVLTTALEKLSTTTFHFVQHVCYSTNKHVYELAYQKVADIVRQNGWDLDVLRSEAEPGSGRSWVPGIVRLFSGVGWQDPMRTPKPLAEWVGCTYTDMDSFTEEIEKKREKAAEQLRMVVYAVDKPREFAYVFHQWPVLSILFPQQILDLRRSFRRPPRKVIKLDQPPLELLELCTQFQAAGLAE